MVPMDPETVLVVLDPINISVRNEIQIAKCGIFPFFPEDFSTSVAALAALQVRLQTSIHPLYTDRY
jgi:hypothetical protein